MSEATKEDLVVVTGALTLAPTVRSALPPDAIVVAADGGLDLALEAGLTPAMLVGDLDSITAEGLAWAEEHAEIRRHPVDKDTTDTELALEAALNLGAGRITLVGGGDRLDHTVAALGALGAPSMAGLDHLDAWWGEQHLEVLHAPRSRELEVMPGSTISLTALHGPCRGVSVSGTRWLLDDADLAAGSGHGVSNVAEHGSVSVSVSSGVLTVFDEPIRPPATRRPPDEE